ncbi:MAG: hypothetical protein IKK00_02225 [Oscillospiraceae bacterium]|nr:hypothetical protein [Clostridia bacterium]MBR4056939.1 hypothetical protein [Oscillospiraceae bacterium]
MKKQGIFAVVAATIMLVGIILAYVCELNTTTIYDPSEGAVTAGIGTHVLVIMLFVIVSAVFLLLTCKYAADNNALAGKHYIFAGAYTLSGLFFSLATGFGVRSNILRDYYLRTNSAPGWYSGDVMDSRWFDDLPQTANRFSNNAKLWYVIMAVAIIITIVLGVRAFLKKAK